MALRVKCRLLVEVGWLWWLYSPERGSSSDRTEGGIHASCEEEAGQEGHGVKGKEEGSGQEGCGEEAGQEGSGQEEVVRSYVREGTLRKGRDSSSHLQGF